MEVKNRLREFLQEMGIRTVVPTDQVLVDKLGGMTLIRFNKLLANAGKPIHLHEVQLLTNWLSELTGRPKSGIDLLNMENKEAVSC